MTSTFTAREGYFDCPALQAVIAAMDVEHGSYYPVNDDFTGVCSGLAMQCKSGEGINALHYDPDILVVCFQRESSLKRVMALTQGFEPSRDKLDLSYNMRHLPLLSQPAA